MKKQELKYVIFKMLELKLVEIRKEINNISIIDLYNYINNIILKKDKIRNVNDAAFYIMNIKVNKLFEYINYESIKDDSNTIASDLKSILEG
ncbi:hypothetical protein [Spiroplasma tabanidicola]|uniref:Uncharacterized protein n=1 Tax=Spiroplasma tabanidicola TaxID=324079 RepID=A0A6I6C6R0_9MOLU|nr:hypothetical protein [Spiroplasma tabanidicola]QGS51880.1 hypothetical protein STABA_v1c05170 [Spiroplasma tabanidicola]